MTNNLHILDHPLATHKLAILRDKNTPSALFRTTLAQLSWLLAYPAFAALKVTPRKIDTPLEPIDAADATFATDNFKAGELIGQWAAASLGDEAANARIAMLDLAVSQPSVGVLRDQGFMTGFGIDVKDPNRWGDEDDPRRSTPSSRAS